MPFLKPNQGIQQFNGIEKDFKWLRLELFILFQKKKVWSLKMFTRPKYKTSACHVFYYLYFFYWTSHATEPEASK